MKKAAFIFALLSLVAVMAFQNCSAPFTAEKTLESTLESVKDTTFDYPYSGKPEFYHHIALFRHVSDIDTLSEFTFIGAASYIADATASVTYTVSVKNADGAVICPTQTGTLLEGESSIEFDCVAPVTNTSAVVTLAVSAAGKTATFEQAF